MSEIKLIEFIKLPFKNIYLFLLVVVLTFIATYSLVSNFSNKYTFYGTYNFALIEDKQKKQIFSNYLTFNFGDKHIDKETYFILYNIKKEEISDQDKAVNILSEVFEKNILNSFYNSSFYNEYMTYIKKENQYMDIELKRIERSITNINANYLKLIKDSDEIVNISENEISDIMRTLIDQDDEFRRIIIDLSRSIIDLKNKITSNNYFLNKEDVFKGKLYLSNDRSQGFLFYILSLLISVVVCFIFNFARLKE